MLVTNLSEMEQIVDSNHTLFWDGWNVVQYKKSDRSQFDKNGVFFRGKWHRKTVFPITENGWELPKEFGRYNV